jgi:hypothetical protein
MRFVVKALRDVQKAYGDRNFDLKEGETVELSPTGYELVMGRHFDGDFELLEEIPETPREKANVERRKEIVALADKTKADLLKEADKRDLTVPSNARKAGILETVTTAVEKEPIEVQTTENKTKRGNR